MQQYVISTTLTNVKAVIKLLRPYQWSKNVLVFGGLIFSGALINYNTLTISILAFIVFSFISSSVYIINDLIDIESDRKHPDKKNRPLASGKISIPVSLLILLAFSTAGFTGAYLFLNKEFLLLLTFYVVINILYSIWLKRIVILDVMIIALGFLIRAIAGCVVINVEASPWLYLCSLVLALFMGFGKRRNEMSVLGEKASAHRLNLNQYSIYFLDLMMTICATATIVTYSLYTMANQDIYHYKNISLIYTIPLVIFSVFRYFFLVQQKNQGGDPTKLLIYDSPSIINGLIWVISVVFIVYGSKIFQMAGI